MYISLILIVAFILLVLIILKLPVFGRLPEGARLARINAIPYVADGTFQNLSHTPMSPEGVSMFMILKKVIKGNPNKRPPRALPFIKPDLTSGSGTKLTWFGHSSYLLQIDKLKILVDPVFSKTTSPFSFIGNKSYDGTDFVHAEDFSEIDIVVITHDHYDHMDYETILKIKNKVKHFVTSLGAGSHLERWGISTDQITELAWGEQAALFGLNFTATSGRHFTGRQFKRNHTLWSSFVLETPQHKLFLGGDSGYDTHFKTIGDQYGPFDLAILECGQYNEYWPYIHMFPEDTVKAAKDLQAKVLLPVHWAKFSLSIHDWDESILRVTKSAEEQGQAITTPLLGETINIGENYPDTKWWLNVAEAKQ
ncbi:MBL fold metallo-hydrolase [Pedobacter sp. L105]|uniref:MBL fold metallo-hydrolase n=1 Tax=Pedobacter sp. L105 TaxID=1641871 RepID=UPI00131C2E9A|nr:MBL fold metallo-hydrolase [Pedobacter sp. L105]